MTHHILVHGLELLSARFCGMILGERKLFVLLILEGS
jgi:hypothetical protein